MIPHAVEDTAVSHYEPPPTCLQSVFHSFRWTHFCLTGLRFICVSNLRISEGTCFHTDVKTPTSDKFAHLNQSEFTSLHPFAFKLNISFWQNFVNLHSYLIPLFFFPGSLKSKPRRLIILLSTLLDWQALQAFYSFKLPHEVGQISCSFHFVLCKFSDEGQFDLILNSVRHFTLKN